MTKKDMEPKNKHYIYIVKDSYGKVTKGELDAKSKMDVHSFLVNQAYQVIDIMEHKSNLVLSKSITRSYRFKPAKLSFFLTQLSTYIKSGIALPDALAIIRRQTPKKIEQRIIQNVIYELNTGVDFSIALENLGEVFPGLLINMLKTAEITGQIADTLDDMALYYHDIDTNRKEIVSAMTYPLAILILSFIIVTFIMAYVVPQFVNIYSKTNTNLPNITKFIISLSNNLQNNIIFIVLGSGLLIIIINYLYKHVCSFRKSIQIILMNVPIVKDIIINSQVIMFTKTFGSLMKNDVFITDSMKILSRVTNNEVYKDLINKATSALQKGDNMSDTFKCSKYFPSVAYEMLVTGEKTSRMSEMMGTVSKYYQNLQKNLVSQLKSLVEPIMIIILAIVVGTILLSIIIPMFDIYNSIG